MREKGEEREIFRGTGRLDRFGEGSQISRTRGEAAWKSRFEISSLFSTLRNLSAPSMAKVSYPHYAWAGESIRSSLLYPVKELTPGVQSVTDSSCSERSTLSSASSPCRSVQSRTTSPTRELSYHGES